MQHIVTVRVDLIKNDFVRRGAILVLAPLFFIPNLIGTLIMEKKFVPKMIWNEIMYGAKRYW